MSSFLKVPFFSKYLLMSLMARSFRLTGNSIAFLKMLGKRSFNDETRPLVYKDYSFSERDVVAAVYSKSGTNWLMQTLQTIICRGECPYEHIHQVVAWPESPFDFMAPLHDFKAPESAWKGRRVIKSAGKPGSMPYLAEPQYFSLIRDPKEAFVSGYHFLPGVFGLGGSVRMEDFLELFLSPEYPAGSWAAHTAGWWALRDQPNVHVYTFNEMKEDREGCTKRMAEQLGVPLTDAELSKVLEKNSFAWMKAHHECFDPPILPLNNPDKIPSMVRKGASGKSGETLSLEQQAAIDDYCMNELKRLDSDFPYRELFMAPQEK